MKFFIDTANLDQIKEAQDLGILDGVTTNPSLMAKEGITGEKNIIDHYLKICEIVDGDVSAEVMSVDYDGIIREGEALAALHDQIVIKGEGNQDLETGNFGNLCIRIKLLNNKLYKFVNNDIILKKHIHLYDILMKTDIVFEFLDKKKYNLYLNNYIKHPLSENQSLGNIISKLALNL